MLSATKARKNFFKLIERASRPASPVTITVDGEAKVVMMSAEEFEGWMETLEIMSDPELVKGIKEAEESYKRGEKTYTLEEIKKELNLN